MRISTQQTQRFCLHKISSLYQFMNNIFPSTWIFNFEKLSREGRKFLMKFCRGEAKSWSDRVRMNFCLIIYSGVGMRLRGFKSSGSHERVKFVNIFFGWSVGWHQWWPLLGGKFYDPKRQYCGTGTVVDSAISRQWIEIVHASQSRTLSLINWFP